MDTLGATYTLAFEKRALIPTSLLFRAFTAGIKGVGARATMRGAVRETIKRPGVMRAMTGTGPKTQLITGLMKQRGLRFGRPTGPAATYRSPGRLTTSRRYMGMPRRPIGGRPAAMPASASGIPSPVFSFSAGQV